MAQESATCFHPPPASKPRWLPQQYGRAYTSLVPEDNKTSPLDELLSLRRSESQDGQQTKRILWIVPNFRAVNAGAKLPPQSVKEKFKTGALDSFDYSSFIFVGIQAGISQSQMLIRRFDKGRRIRPVLLHTFADQTDENLWVEGILPSVLHEDSRYYTLGHGGFIKRGFYAVTRTVITRTDSGRKPSTPQRSWIRHSSRNLLHLLPNQYQTWTKMDSAG